MKEKLNEALNVGGVKNDSLCPSMTFKQRMIGFLACAGTGSLLTVLVYILFLTGNLDPVQFVVIFTLANICVLMGSCFLMGPKSQFKRMVKPTRLITTIVLVLLIIATIVCAFVWSDKTFLILVLGICQFLAMIWYNLSFIPYGRSLVKKCFKKCCNFEEEEEGS